MPVCSSLKCRWFVFNCFTWGLHKWICLRCFDVRYGSGWRSEKRWCVMWSLFQYCKEILGSVCVHTTCIWVHVHVIISILFASRTDGQELGRMGCGTIQGSDTVCVGGGRVLWIWTVINWETFRFSLLPVVSGMSLWPLPISVLHYLPNFTLW